MLNNNTPTSTFDLDCYNIDEMTAEWFEGLISEHSHDARGRIMSLKLSLYLLEQQSLTPDIQRLIDRMKLDIEQLTGMVEHLKEGSHPCDT